MTSPTMACENTAPDNCQAAYSRLQRAICGATDGLWEWDLTDQKVWYAPRFLELLDVSEDEFLPTIDSWTDRLHQQDYTATWNAVQRHLLDGDEYNVKYRLRIGSGDNYRWFRARGTAYRDASGKPQYMAGSISDIDDLQEAYFQLQEKESQILQQQKLDALGSLASGISHEFNNLLQTMRGYAQFALDSVDSDSQASEDLHCVLTAAEKASSLTRQMLDFSRCDKPNAQPCLIDNVVRDLTQMLNPLLPDNIDFRLDLNAEAQRILIDPIQMQQALLNLCLNSKDAMLDGGVLQVRSDLVMLSDENVQVRKNLQSGLCVRLTVADSGTGISPEAQQHIFDPFYTTKEVGKGTGLGLAVAFGVVQQASGHIECSSSSKYGTKFLIHLPIDTEIPTTLPIERSRESWGS